jgi:hypothetical protein
MKTLFVMLALAFISMLSAYTQNNKIIDQRAFSHYTENEIAEMPLSKIHQINYLYRESFSIAEESVGKINPETIDAFNLSAFRKENERVKISIDIDREGKKTDRAPEYIILFSHKEVDEAFKKISSQYSEN